MFGWEFPPHISGGLGTACYGLTRAMIQENLEVLFVVPKAFGGEAIDLISATDVLIPDSENLPDPTSEEELAASELKVIAVPANLMPYVNPGLHYRGLEQWNYPAYGYSPAIRRKEGGWKVQLSGTYGPNLLDEVQRYATVAGAIARQHRFNVIHAHDWLTYPAGIAAKKASGRPLVVHVHATEFDRKGDHVDQRVYDIERAGMEQADKVVAVSEWTSNIVVSRYGIPRSKVSVVHNGVAMEKKPPLKQLPGIGRPVVTFLGRVTRQKGPAYFVDAAVAVLKKFPNARFVLAGSGDMLPAMLERVAKFRRSANFYFTGFLNEQEVESVWRVTDLYVMPSVSEPFGISPLEAIRAGVPAIVSKQSGVGEVMPHVICTDFWDVEALTNAICNVLHYKSLSETLKKEGSEEIKQVNWNTAARKLKHIYHAVTQ